MIAVHAGIWQTACRRWWFCCPPWPESSFYMVVDNFGNLVRVNK